MSYPKHPVDRAPIPSATAVPRFTTSSRVAVAFSLGRIIAINVFALAATVAATVHVVRRPSAPTPVPQPHLVAGPHAEAARPLPPPAPALDARSLAVPGAGSPLEVDVDIVDPVVAKRPPTYAAPR